MHSHAMAEGAEHGAGRRPFAEVTGHDRQASSADAARPRSASQRPTAPASAAAAAAAAAPQAAGAAKATKRAAGVGEIVNLVSDDEDGDVFEVPAHPAKPKPNPNPACIPSARPASGRSQPGSGGARPGKENSCSGGSGDGRTPSAMAKAAAANVASGKAKARPGKVFRQTMLGFMKKPRADMALAPNN